MISTTGMDLIERAKIFALGAHEAVGQKRKFTGEPYYNHVFDVGEMLYDFYLPPDIVAAGYLHDTVEDTSVTLDVIEEYFGYSVAIVVNSLTENKSLPRKRRKAMTRERFRKATLLVRCTKLADMISNTKTLPVTVESDSKFASWRKLYLSEQKALLDTMKTYDPTDFLTAGSRDREAYEDLLHIMTRVLTEQDEASQ